MVDAVFYLLSCRHRAGRSKAASIPRQKVWEAAQPPALPTPQPAGTPRPPARRYRGTARLLLPPPAPRSPQRPPAAPRAPTGTPRPRRAAPQPPGAGGRRLRAAAARCRPRAGASRSPPAAAAYFSHSGGGGPRRDAGPGGGCRHREPRRAGVRAVHSSGKLCRRLPIGGTGTGEGLGAAERGSGRRGAAAHGGSGARCGACPGAGRAGCLAAR